jgi:hypothetical protein
MVKLMDTNGKTFTIEVYGQTQPDIENALAEVLRLVRRGMLMDAGEDDTGGFRFESSGEYVDARPDDEKDE